MIKTVEIKYTPFYHTPFSRFSTIQILFYTFTKTEDHKPRPVQLLLQEDTPEWQRNELRKMGYTLSFDDHTSSPINAIYFDWKHNSFWGGSSNLGED